ncbi:MAG TPA: hypothetical protein VKY65_00425 [Alphaproteobacteria bacterium]|nr:hypothetical protein [Alphaproteobacteria bacterium]
MLAYLFWHRAKGDADKDTYEAVLRRFHEALNEHAYPGFLGSATYRISAVPWLGDQGGYEDWYYLQGSWALDLINAEAPYGRMERPHNDIAALMDIGHGGLYALVRGESTCQTERSTIRWLSRPRGSVWRPLIEYIHNGAHPPLACWRRQMVLGPAPEFALITRAGQPVRVPEGWSEVAEDRSCLWPKSPNAKDESASKINPQNEGIGVQF